MIKKLKLLYKTCKTVRTELKNCRSSDIASQLDCIYYSCSILHKIICRFNISSDLSYRFDNFIENGYGLISSTALSEKIDSIIIFYNEVIKFLIIARNKLN